MELFLLLGNGDEISMVSHGGSWGSALLLLRLIEKVHFFIMAPCEDSSDHVQKDGYAEASYGMVPVYSTVLDFWDYGNLAVTFLVMVDCQRLSLFPHAPQGNVFRWRPRCPIVLPLPLQACIGSAVFLVIL